MALGHIAIRANDRPLSICIALGSGGLVAERRPSRICGLRSEEHGDVMDIGKMKLGGGGESGSGMWHLRGAMRNY